MKAIGLGIFLATVFINSASAERAEGVRFNILCELGPDVAFHIFSVKDEMTQKYFTYAGLTYQKTEAGNPSLCEIKSISQDLLILLNCEDQNISSGDYTLKFTRDFRSGLFTVLKTDKDSNEEEYKLCQNMD